MDLFGPKRPSQARARGKHVRGETRQARAARQEFDRRAFFVKLGLGSLSIAATGTAVFAYQLLSPNVLYEPSPIVNAGKPEGYPRTPLPSM